MSEEEKGDLKTQKREEDDTDDEEEQKRLEEEKRARKEAVKKRKEEMKRKADEKKRREKALREDEDEDEEEIPTTTTTKSKKIAPAIREDIVNSSVNFLNHPKVKPSPLSQKMAFLQKKGLTQEEIQEALNRANVVTPTYAPQPAATIGVIPPPQYAPPIPYQQPIQPVSSPWYGGKLGFLLTAVTCVGAGVGFTFLAKKYLLPKNEENEKKTLEKQEENKVETKKLVEEVTGVLKEMQTQNGELKETLKTLLTQSHSSSPQNGMKNSSSTEQLQKIEIAELKSELKKMKAMILDSKSSNNLSQNSPSIVKGWTPSAETKLPAWMEKDSSKSPLSFEDPYSRMLEKAQNRGSTGEGSASTSLEEEPRPKDFGRILQMVQNGQIPDDVKPINDKPLDPHFKIERGQRQAPLKPWQRASSITSETTVTDPSYDSNPRVEEIIDEKDTSKENGSPIEKKEAIPV